jgi:hypothetical protein
MSCDLGPTIAQNSDLQLQVCLGSEGNCLKPIALGTTPYAIQSSYSEWSQNTAHADISTQAHYAHRITSDRNLLVTGVSDPNVGYFDFYTSSDDTRYTDLLYMGNEFPSATRHGFIQWTPLSSEGNSLHIVSKSADSDEALGPLDSFYVHGLNTVFSHDATVKQQLTVERNANIATTLRVGQTITVPGDGNELTGTGTVNAETLMLNGPASKGYLFVNGSGYATNNSASGLMYDGELNVLGNGAAIAAGQGSSSDELGVNDKVGRVKADSLMIHGDTSIARDTAVGRDLQVAGSAAVTGNTTVGGNAVVAGTTTSSGTISTAANIVVAGDGAIAGRIEVEHSGGEASSYIQELRVNNLTVLSQLTQGDSVTGEGVATSQNLSVATYANIGTDLKIGDADGVQESTTIHMHGDTGNMEMDGNLSVDGNTVLDGNLHVTGTFTMPGAVGWDNGVRANQLMLGIPPDFNSSPPFQSTTIAPKSNQSLQLLTNSAFYHRVGNNVMNFTNESYTALRGGLYFLDSTDKTGTTWQPLDTVNGKTDNSFIHIQAKQNQIVVGDNLGNSNCSGCSSAAGGDPRSYNDPVGRVVADSFYGRGDSYIGRNLKTIGQVEASSFNTAGAVTSNTVYASTGVRGNGIMVGQAPDYNVGWPYETISTKSTGHNLRLSSAGALVFQNRNTVRMQINGNGQADFFKGIYIKGNLPGSQSYSSGWGALFNSASNFNRADSGAFGFGLRIDGWSMAHAYMAVSDERVKDIQHLSDSAQDLKMLNEIEVTDYVYKDFRQHGNKVHKKVIAQQVEKVFPQAVEGDSTAFIPDVYQMSESISLAEDLKELSVHLTNHGLTEGEQVRLIGPEGENDLFVTDVADKDLFVVSGWESGPVDNVFVYGRRIDDLKTVDYEAIAMLNVSATQELSSQLETAQHTIEELKTQNQTLQSRLDRIESRLNKINHPQTEQKAQVVSQPRSWVQNLIMWWRS